MPPLDLSNEEIRKALDRVEARFPFPGYMTRGARKEMESLVPLVGEHLDARRNGPPRLLDIGSGPMDKTAVFAELGFECSAADDLADPWHQVDDRVEKIQAFARDAGIRFHRQSSADHSIPFQEGSFDVVTLLAVIEHLHESPRGILNAAGRFLRPGGLLAVTMPNAVNLRKRLAVLLGRSNYPPVEQLYYAPGQWRGHVREYTLDEAVWVVEANGLSVQEATTLEGMAYDTLGGPLLAAFLGLRKLVPTLGSILCVLAEKPEGWSPATVDPERFLEASRESVPPSVI